MIAESARSAFDSPLWLDFARVVAAVQVDIRAEARTGELQRPNAATGCGRRLGEGTIRALDVPMVGEDT